MSNPYEGDATGSGTGLTGNSESGDGVYGFSAQGIGVHGCNAEGSDPDGPGGPGIIPAKGCGVFGESLQYQGVFGASGISHGVYGVNGLPSKLTPGFSCGVWGDSAAGYGVFATSGSQAGVFGTSKGGDGVHGETTSQSRYGVSALNNSAWPCCAMYASSNNGHGVHGVNQGSSGHTPNAGCGVWGESAQGNGVYGSSKSGSAGMFDGNVQVNGTHTVNGSVQVNGKHSVTGDINVTGNVNVAYGGDVKLAGADCAELFDLATPEVTEPGTVMVIDGNGALRRSEKAYDRAVAGVVSGAGDFRPGIVLDQHADNAGRATIALVGKVYCKVDASAGAIAVGDLLTTSDTPGHAMRVADPHQAFGAVIGKALRPLRHGRGLLPILVALQ